MDREPVLYGLPEASRLLGISESKLKELVGAGRVGSVKIGRRRLVPAQAIREFADALIAASAS